MLIRLQKVIAESGVASRREAEAWIAAGRITVNGQMTTKLGTQVDPAADCILVDGRPLKKAPQKYYYLFHKPKNVLVARKDPRGRPIIYDYLQDLPTLLHPAGRLDFDSEGLILLSNDGALIRKLTHPSSKVPKLYQVKVKGRPNPAGIKKLLTGISLGDGEARALACRVFKENTNNHWLELTISEGRNRQVRRMCQAIGCEVLRLRRVALGPLQLGDLPAAHCRPLTAAERKSVGGLA